MRGAGGHLLCRCTSMHHVPFVLTMSCSIATHCTSNDVGHAMVYAHSLTHAVSVAIGPGS